MAKLCIPSVTVDKIKGALVSGKLSLADLYNMPSSEARQAEFAKFLPKELAQFVNTKFEAAAASNSKNALRNFVKELTTEKEKTANKTKNLLEKISQLEDADLINTDSQQATFTDLISDRLGISVTVEEIEVISQRAEEINELKAELITAQKKDLPTKEYFVQRTKAEVAYHDALTEMDKYMNSLTPTSNLKVITGTIFRGNMLLNIPPAMINTISNAVQGVMQGAERRIASGQLGGLNTDFAIEYFKMVVKVFHETGYDISRQYAEDIRLGEHIVHSEGPGIVRATGRGISKVVFKYLLGYSDVISAAVAAADSTNVATTKIAKVMGKTGKAQQELALEIFKQSTMNETDLTSPIIEEALITRTQAIADAEFATWTNKGWLAQRSIGLRDWLNDTTGDLQLGFWNIPFVKTGANVIQFGLESSPIGGIVALGQLKSALNMKNDKINPNPKEFQRVMRLAVRSGMGTVLSMILAAMIPPDDFFTAYEVTTQKQRDQLGLKKGVYNAVKIGNKWVSLDFFGALGAPFVGMMYARKYGDGLTDPESYFKMFQGIGSQALQVPGLQDFEGLYKSMKDILKAKTKEEAGSQALSASINSVRARAIPGILNTFAKATDVKARQIDRDDLLSRTKAGIPGLRQGLRAKVDITTGKDVEGEGFFTNLLFGSRIKTANESVLIDEITRLESAGQGPAVSDLERSSTKVQGLKAQLTREKYQDALKYFGEQYGRLANRLIKTTKYTRASDEDKKDMLNKIRTEVRARMLKRFGFRKPRSKGKR
jgi:hypothetical protein